MKLHCLGVSLESLQVGGDRFAKLWRQLPEGRPKKLARQTLHRFQYLLYHKDTSLENSPHPVAERLPSPNLGEGLGERAATSPPFSFIVAVPQAGSVSSVTRSPSLGLSEQALDSTLRVVSGGEL